MPTGDLNIRDEISRENHTFFTFLYECKLRGKARLLACYLCGCFQVWRGWLIGRIWLLFELLLPVRLIVSNIVSTKLFVLIASTTAANIELISVRANTG